MIILNVTRLYSHFRFFFLFLTLTWMFNKAQKNPQFDQNARIKMVTNKIKRKQMEHWQFKLVVFPFNVDLNQLHFQRLVVEGLLFHVGQLMWCWQKMLEKMLKKRFEKDIYRLTFLFYGFSFILWVNDEKKNSWKCES